MDQQRERQQNSAMAAGQQPRPTHPSQPNSQLIAQLQQHRPQQQQAVQFNNRHPQAMAGMPSTAAVQASQSITTVTGAANNPPNSDPNNEQRLTPQEELSKFVESL